MAAAAASRPGSSSEAGAQGGRARTLKGSLVLRGDGDPALAAAGFAGARGLPLTSLGPLAKAVKEAGIRRVKGKVVADPTVFDGKGSVPVPGVNPDLGDLPTLSGLSFNRGTDAGGGYAASPARNAGDELIAELRERGIRVTGGVKVSGTPGRLLDKEPLGSVASPSAASLAAQTNTPSDNFYAEMLLKRIGTGPNKQGTTRRGAGRTEAFTRKAGSNVHMVNGSGLARSNTASPKNVARLLTYMRKSDSQKARLLRLARHGRAVGNPQRPHAQHGGRRPLPRQDRDDQRRERPLGLLPGGRGHSRLLDPHEQRLDLLRPARTRRNGRGNSPLPLAQPPRPPPTEPPPTPHPRGPPRGQTLTITAEGPDPHKVDETLHVAFSRPRGQTRGLARGQTLAGCSQFEELAELRFVDHVHAEVLGLGEL